MPFPRRLVRTAADALAFVGRAVFARRSAYTTAHAMSPTPFRIDIPEEMLTDLRRRLDAVRMPAAPPGSGWTYGTDADYLRALIDYWRDVYDWRAVEAHLNRLPHYRAEIDGLPIHFVHERGSGARPLPLILTHGWPGSFIEFDALVDPLAHPERHGGDPADAFDVVVPSLPGYAFSGRPDRPVGPRAIGRMWHRLMTDVLGYERFGAQGGDWGSMVSTWLAYDQPGALAGLHLNMVGVRPPLGEGAPPLDTEEQAWMRAATGRMRMERGYREIQATRPQTLAVALADSPVGLASWIVDKFHAWGDTGGDVESRFPRDTLLTNVMLYWCTGTADSASWIYYAAREQGDLVLPTDGRVTVPTGVAAFPVDLIPPPPRQYAERAYDVVRWTDMPAGGHFAALEEPERLIEDIRAFFRPLRG